MSKLNVFVDGSWLFKACAAEGVLANRTERPQTSFRLDFSKLNSAFLNHVRGLRSGCNEMGTSYIATSIFDLPPNFDNWPSEFDNVTSDDIARTRSGVAARERFVDLALAAGYSDQAVYRPRMKGWILEKLRTMRYQEKQVDATVVALLVRSAIVSPNDVHVVITGDVDILPAIKVAYPEYSTNVFLATTHPDELAAEHRQTSFSLNNFDFEIPPFYLQDYAAAIFAGDHVYACVHCNKVFSRPNPIPTKARPCCSPCHSHRT